MLDVAGERLREGNLADAVEAVAKDEAYESDSD